VRLVQLVDAFRSTLHAKARIRNLCDRFSPPVQRNVRLRPCASARSTQTAFQ
jgi:hypothetical protein